MSNKGLDISKNTDFQKLSESLRNTIFEFKGYLQMEIDRSKNTIDAYLSDIILFSKFLNTKKITSFSDIDTDVLIEWIADVSKETKATTQSRKISAVRCLAKFLVEEDIWQKNYADLISLPKTRRNIPEILTGEEITKLLSAPSNETPEGLRDIAMLELMYSSGLRVSELCNLKLSDIDLKECIIRVRGKGSKTRLVPMGSFAIEAINKYILVRANLIGKKFVDEIFVTKRGSAISRKTYWYNIKKYAISVGIEKNVKPHILRHSFATHLLQNGANLIAISEMLGHSDLSTTQIYTQLATEEIYKQHTQKHPRNNF